MGIEGLLPALKPVTQQGHLSSFQGKTAAIDTMSWLYKGAYACAFELAVGKPTTGYLVFVYRMYCLLKRWSITPIFCLDGRQVKAKEKTLKRRYDSKKKAHDKGMELLNSGNESEAHKVFTKSLRITDQMIYRLVDMLRSLEVEVIIAPYEADSQIAYLCRNKIADFAITEDSDVICYNCPIAVFKLGILGGCEVIDVASLRERREKKESLGDDKMDILFSLSEKEFSYACIMAGCDYIPSVKGMGIKKVIKYFERFKTVESVIRRIKVEPTFMNKVPEGYLNAVKRFADIFLYQLVYDPRSKTMVTLHEVEDEEEFVEQNKDCIGNWIPDIESFAKGSLNIRTLREREIEKIDIKDLLGANVVKREEMNSGSISSQYLKEAALAEARKKQGFSQPNLGTTNATGLRPDQLRSYSQVVVNNKRNSNLNIDDGFFDNEEIPYEAFESDEPFMQGGSKKKGDAPTLKFDEDEKEDIDERIDFLFEICQEYSKGFHEKEEEKLKDDIPDFIHDAQLNLTMSEDGFDLEQKEKPIIPLKNLFGGGASPFKAAPGPAKLVDSFKKVNLFSQSQKLEEDNGRLKTPIKSCFKMSIEKTSPSVQASTEKVNKHKRKLSDISSQIELEENEKENCDDRKSDLKETPTIASKSATPSEKKEEVKKEPLKKTKKNSFSVDQNQPKISIFLKK